VVSAQSSNWKAEASASLMSRAIFSGSSRYSASIMGTSGQTYINALARLKGGFTAIPAFRADLPRVTGRPDIDVWNNAEQFRDPARRVTGYEAACLLAFALAALVAAFFLIGQSVARYTSATVPDLQVLQAVGMMPRQAVASAAVSPFLAAAAGATLSVAGTIVASRWMPIGAASLVEPRPGVDADWLVLGTGWAVAPLLVLAGSAAAAATALAASRRQTVSRAGQPSPRPWREQAFPCRRSSAHGSRSSPDAAAPRCRFARLSLAWWRACSACSPRSRSPLGGQVQTCRG